MKKLYIILAISVLPCGFAFSQGMDDIYTLQQSSLYGTPRFSAMGGAFGALGTDVSASLVNPAAGAVSNKNSVALTLGPEWNYNKSNFYGTIESSSSRAVFTLPQGGVNLNFLTDNPLSGFGGMSLVINYSRNYNFNNQYYFRGRNTTRTDYNNGNPVGSSLIESMFRNIVDNGYTDGVEGLGITTGAIEKTADGNYFPGAVYNDIDQEGSLAMAGSSSTTTFALSFNIASKVYLGVSYQMINMNIRENDFFLREYGFTSDNTLLKGGVSHLNFDRYTSQNGYGGNFAFGIIGRIGSSLRLGATIKTPEIIYINESYEYFMRSEFFDNSWTEASDNPTYWSANRYSFKVPTQFLFSAAYIFGQVGILSLDYSFRDYSFMQFRDKNAFRTQNDIIRQQMGFNHNVRVGAEIRLYPVSIRLGAGIELSPFKDVTVERVNQQGAGQPKNFVNLPQGVGDRYLASCGIGYSFGKFVTADVSYNFSRHLRYFYLYEPYLVDPIKTNINEHRFAVGVTVSF